MDAGDARGILEGQTVEALRRWLKLLDAIVTDDLVAEMVMNEIEEDIDLLTVQTSAQGTIDFIESFLGDHTVH